MGFYEEYLPIRHKYEQLIKERIDLLSDDEKLKAGAEEFVWKESWLVYDMNLIKVKYGMAGANKDMKKPKRTRKRCEEQTKKNES